MLQKNRFSYFILIISTIVLGILSRKIVGVPTFFGDILYAIMIYFGMKFLFIKNNFLIIFIIALIFCFGIEFLQLYTAEWMVAIRRTTLGRYVLGQGFLWSDLAYYTFGIIIAFLIDFNLVNRN